jgi:hypothetical protein
VNSALIAAVAATVVTVAAPHKGDHPCLTEAQVEDLTLFALPPLLEGMATRCGPSLPADAYLLNGGRTLAGQLGPESASRWPGASLALAAIAEDKFPTGLSEQTARGLVRDLAASEMLGKLKPGECERINRLAELLSPLPPRNLAGIFVTVAEMVGKGDKKRKSAPIICPATPS